MSICIYIQRVTVYRFIFINFIPGYIGFLQRFNLALKNYRARKGLTFSAFKGKLAQGGTVKKVCC
jgi:hypothetical protein